MKPQVAGRTGLRKDTLTITLDFDFRIGSLEREGMSHEGYRPWIRQYFTVFLGGDGVMEVYRDGRGESWEWRWVGAPAWLRGAVDVPMFLDGGKVDAARRVTRAFEHGVRQFFQHFDTDQGRIT